MKASTEQIMDQIVWLILGIYINWSLEANKGRAKGSVRSYSVSVCIELYIFVHAVKHYIYFTGGKHARALRMFSIPLVKRKCRAIVEESTKKASKDPIHASTLVKGFFLSEAKTVGNYYPDSLSAAGTEYSGK